MALHGCDRSLNTLLPFLVPATVITICQGWRYAFSNISVYCQQDPKYRHQYYGQDKMGSKSLNFLDLKNPFFWYTGIEAFNTTWFPLWITCETIWNLDSSCNLSNGIAMAGMCSTHYLTGATGGSSIHRPQGPDSFCQCRDCQWHCLLNRLNKEHSDCPSLLKQWWWWIQYPLGNHYPIYYEQPCHLQSPLLSILTQCTMELSASAFNRLTAL